MAFRVPLRCLALVELCCDADSELSSQAGRFGVEALRITKDDRLDLDRGVEKALSFISSRSAVDAWSAVPCTAWCTWNYVNEAKLGPAFVKRLAYRRRRSIS